MGQVLFYLLYEGLGEQAFFKTTEGFYREYRNTGATSRQFVEYFNKGAGRDLGKLFEEWVFTPRASDLIAAGTTLDELVRRYR
jgi:aminopeptidase N